MIYRTLLLAAVVGGVSAGWPAFASPHVPKSKDAILEKIPVNLRKSESAEIRRLREAMKTNPRDHESAVGLARVYLAQARAESDPRFLSYAQGVLQPWWDDANPPGSVQLLRGIILQSSHQFQPALRDLDAYLVKHLRDGEAWLAKMTVLQVLGRLEEARQCSLSVLQSAPELAGLTGVASVMSMNGQAARSLMLLTNALARTGEPPKGGANRNSRTELLAALTVAAELAGRLGRAGEATALYERALALNEPDAYLLGSFADHLLDTGEASRVVALLQSQTQADGLLLRLALAERDLLMGSGVKHIEMLRARFEASLARGDRVHLREEARFNLHLLDRPEEALNLALENWTVQKEPWDIRLVLEAAEACGKPEAAHQVRDWVAKHQFEDVHLKNQKTVANR